MFSVKVRSGHSDNKELRSISVRAGVGHGKQALLSVLENEVFIPKSLGSVNASASSTVAVDEVSSLNHEVADDSVEFASFVALALTSTVLRLTSTELAEVLRGARHNILVEFKGDSAKRLTSEGNVKEDQRVSGFRKLCGRHLGNVERQLNRVMACFSGDGGK